MSTIFDRLLSSRIEPEPFPHLSVANCLERNLIERLIATRPDLSRFQPRKFREGEKLHLPSRITLEDKNISPVWKATIKNHLEEDSVRVWLGAFAPFIRDYYPELEPKLGSIESWKVGQRGQADESDCQIFVDAQISVHLPCPGTRVQERSPHLKMSNKLLIAQFLLRLPEDEDAGADTEIYELEPGAKLLFGVEQQVINRNRIKICKSIPYEANRAIFFLNSPHSIQAFSEREHSPHPIFYMNLIAQLREPLFTLPLLLPKT